MVVTILNKDNFDNFIASNPFVIIDFWAKWCGPCKSFSKVIEAAAQKYTDIKFASIDIEAEPELANDFNVRSVPLLLVLRESIIVYGESGALPASALDTLIQQAKALDMQTVRNHIQTSNQNTDQSKPS